MSDFMILYLIGCLTALAQFGISTYYEYTKMHEDIVVEHIFQAVCATLSSWFYVVGGILSRYPKIFEATIIKYRKKEE